MEKVRSAKKRRHAVDSPSRVSKFLAAGVTAAAFGVVAVNPVSPVPGDVKAQAEERDVALTAAAEPIVLLRQSLAETISNLGYLGVNGTNSALALAAAFQAANPIGELMEVIAANAGNPQPLFERLLAAPEVYGDDLQMAFFGREDDPTTTVNENYDGVIERFQLSFTEFETLLADLQVYDPPANDPTQGFFTNMAFELNYYYVFGVIDNLRPLVTAMPSGYVPLFSIPGDILGGEVNGGFDGALPGVDRLDNLINVLNEQTLVRAASGPFQTAFFQIAKSLDDALVAYQAGDTELVTNELANLPLRAVNAFVNGFAPSFTTPAGAEWPSLIDATQTAAGLFKYIAVDLPNQITTALGGTTPEYETPQPPAPAAPGVANNRVSPLAATGDIVVEEKTEVTPTEIVDTEGGTVDPTGTTEEKSPATPTSKRPTSTWGTTTPKDVFKKVHSDIEKTVNGIFGRKTESTKAEPTTTTGPETGATGAEGTPEDKSEVKSENENENDESA